MSTTRPTPALPAGDNRPALRTGFSTGAYLSATAVAACKILCGETVEPRMELIFPDGQKRSINIDGTASTSSSSAEAWSIKDAGEDVDATHGLTIRTCVERLAAVPAKFNADDFVEERDGCTFILSAGNGVGHVTRNGLDVPSGKPAINPTPRQMLWENLSRTIPPDWTCLHIKVSIGGGEKVARRTLNPTLGIVDGLSILGTSGLVIPCSHAAYIATIEILIRAAVTEHTAEVALVTGGRSHRWLKTQMPDLPETAIVRFGDFIQQSLDLCQRYGVKQVRIVCMSGKLAKYALGLANTHANKHAQSPVKIAGLLVQSGIPATALSHAKKCCSARELLAQLTPAEHTQALTILKKHAIRQLQTWAGPCRVRLHVLDTSGDSELI